MAHPVVLAHRQILSRRSLHWMSHPSMRRQQFGADGGFELFRILVDGTVSQTHTHNRSFFLRR